MDYVEIYKLAYWDKLVKLPTSYSYYHTIQIALNGMVWRVKITPNDTTCIYFVRDIGRLLEFSHSITGRKLSWWMSTLWISLII